MTSLIAVFSVIVLLAPSALNAQYYYYSTPTYTTPTYTTYQNTYQQTQYNQQLEYLLGILLQVQNQLAQLRGQCAFNCGRVAGITFSGNSEIDITTKSATNINRDDARLRGEVDFNSSNYAYVWFEWGERSNDLDEKTPTIWRDDNDDEDFDMRIRNLDRDERYYFRAVGEDDNGRIDYGSIRNFRTDRSGSSSNRNNDDEPDVDTESARDIDDDSAQLRGEVDMNDFRNGHVFFVYGEDEDQVEDVEDDYDSYRDVDEDGDDLQKVSVDSDLDGRGDYSRTVSNLDDDERYYFSICVAYEDDDDDDVIDCGDVEDFETD